MAALKMSVRFRLLWALYQQNCREAFCSCDALQYLFSIFLCLF